MDDEEFYNKYPCKHRAEDGACAACAYMCPCSWPEDCKLREEVLEDSVDSYGNRERDSSIHLPALL